MAIIPIEPLNLDPRLDLLCEIISLIDEAASSSEPVQPHDLAEEIMELVDRSGYVPEPVMVSSKDITALFKKLKQSAV